MNHLFVQYVSYIPQNRLTLKIIHVKLNVTGCLGFLMINVIYNDNPSRSPEYVVPKNLMISLFLIFNKILQRFPPSSLAGN